MNRSAQSALQVLGLLTAVGFAVPPTLATGDLSQQPPVEVRVQLGDPDNAMRFVPDRIERETGRLYKLVLHNHSPQKHYFSSDGLAGALYTRKVQVLDQAGATLAEVKGTIREIEVYRGQQAEWWLVPVKAGTFADLKFTIPGHADHGMRGTVIIRLLPEPPRLGLRCFNHPHGPEYLPTAGCWPECRTRL